MSVKLPKYLKVPDNLNYFSVKGRIAWNFRHEFILNNANMRGSSFTSKYKVGPTSYLINNCNPLSYLDWVNYYFENAIEQKKDGEKVTLKKMVDLGQGLKSRVKKIFVEIMKVEMIDIPDKVYTTFIYNLTINRTWDGYLAEKKIENLLENAFGLEIFDSKEMENKYLVDKYLEVGNYKIGFQVKPVSYVDSQQITMRSAHKIKHKKFENNYGGKVFFLSYDSKFGVLDSDKIVRLVKSEIERLS